MPWSQAFCGTEGSVHFPPARVGKSFSRMLADLLIFAFAVGLVVAYVAIAIKTVNESES